jgi:SAM-dependent methyltransferase
MSEKYIHSEGIHNLNDPQEIVPEIMRILNPANVVDIGCGLGTFLYCFKKEGVKEVLGIDGAWVNKNALSKYLDEGEFLEKDLEKPFTLNKKFDLAVSLEVAEHLSPESADIFVKNLVNAGKLILFSAAIPLQGGQNHINEQWLTYWEEKFGKHNYIIHDVMRPIFWNNPKIFWWYRQNMVLVAPKEFRLNSNLTYNPLRNVVHYELFSHYAREVHSIHNGDLYPKQYVGFLYKSIIRIFKSRLGKQK